MTAPVQNPATPSVSDIEPQPVNGFAALGVPAEIVAVLAARNITVPTDVQREAIPLAARTGDLVVQAKTGTGKTLAFGIPMVTTLAAGAPVTAPRALVVTPTRELCLQVADDLNQIGGALGLRVVSLYGGQDFVPQIAALEAGVDIVVGTPGRLLDLVSRRHLELGSVSQLILDEADEMLDMGFLPDVQKLLAHTKNRSRTLLFSATMPAPIRTLARTFLSQPTFTTVADPTDAGTTVAGVTQFVYQAHPLDKPEMLARVLQAEGRGPTIVFCRTKMTAQRLADDMTERGFNAASLHGDLTQAAREKGLAAFRASAVDVLIATDVAARGIDVHGITHVVNYQMPEEAATYLHRIGRTARAGRKGIAVTFVEWDNMTRWKFIAQELGLDEAYVVPAETFSTSAHLFTDLDIPTTVKGRLNAAPARTPRRDDQRSGDRRRDGQRSGNRRPGASRSVAPRSTSGSAASNGERPSGRTRDRKRTRRGAAS
jgi:superfamily II DNA/RNA helicase